MLDKLLRTQIKLFITSILYCISLFTYSTPLVLIMMCVVLFYCVKCIDITVIINKKENLERKSKGRLRYV